MKKLINCILSMILVISIVIQPNISQAKENDTEREAAVSTVQTSPNTQKVSLAKKVKTVNITMYLYNGKEIDVPKKLVKARWVVSDKEMVMVTKGKDKNSIALDTKGKTGKCAIKAKLNGKVKYKINLTVKKRIANRKYTGKKVQASLLNFSSRTWILTYRMYNGSKREMSYGPRRYLQRYENGKWKTVYKRHTPIIGDRYRVPAHTSKLQYYNLLDDYSVSRLAPGQYRLFVDYWGNSSDRTCAFVEFKIK